MLLFQYQPGDALNACGPRIFVGDESLDYAIIEALRSVGHHVIAVAHEASGLSDSEVIQMARTLDAVILTADKDFGWLVVGQGERCRGVVLFRLERLDAEQMAQCALQAWQRSGDEWEGSFTVVKPRQIRVRALPKSRV